MKVMERLMMIIAKPEVAELIESVAGKETVSFGLIQL